MAQAIPAGAPPHAARLPALSDHRVARFAAIMVLYFLQGIPWGLATVAIPAWLAMNGATPVAVGVFVATAVLPWSLKPLNGVLMDRFTYKPMGRRRAWILGAQALMLCSLLTLALLQPGPAEISLLAALCFTLNFSATLNDVAIDGMAVDIVPDDERTAVNSCMFASQAAGVAATGAIAGLVMSVGGLQALALVLAVLVAAASVFVSLFRERSGERLLPWSNGQASPECIERQQDAFLPILKGMFGALIKPTTLVFLLACAMSQATFALVDGVAPTLAVQALGWTSDGYSNFAAIVSLAAAAAGLTLPPLIMRMIGMRATIIGICLGLAALAGIGGAMFGQGDASLAFQVLITLQSSLAIVMQITVIVWAMKICSPAIAASLFAVFMSVPNLGRTILIGWSGPVIETGGYPDVYFAVAGFSVLAALLFAFARVGDNRLLAEAAA
ncbi:MAG: MFS transporter [Rhodospirillales bacterium]|nr:MFS transporter [Rhodospirillales bacterium]